MHACISHRCTLAACTHAMREYPCKVTASGNTWATFVKRHQNGEQQKEVAAKVGVDPSTVGRWLKGTTTPTPQQAVGFARSYGAHPVEALLASGYLAPEDVEGRFVIERTPALEAFSTRALVDELEERMEHMSDYAGWIVAAHRGENSPANLGDGVLRYLDPSTPPSETDPEAFRSVFGSRVTQTAEIDGVATFALRRVSASGDDDADLHTVDLSREALELAASDDDTVVDPDR